MSKNIPVNIIYAFSYKSDGGNPAGVVTDADHLSEKQMQSIAKTVGFPETVFISKSKKADFKLDFFTPIRRISDCGHATVAAFSLLRERFPSLTQTSKEIVSGVRDILIKEEKVFMEQPIGSISTLPAPEELLNSLFNMPEGLSSASIIRHDVGFLVVEVDTENNLSRATPNLSEIKAFSEKNDLVGVYLFVKNNSGNFIASTRMFAPAYEINEEAATGMAAGLLSAFLYETTGLSSFVIEQGRHMNPMSPSAIYCEVEPNFKRILVGGSSRVSLSDSMSVSIDL